MSSSLTITSTDTDTSLRTIAEAASGSTTTNELGKDEFLKILCAQMANQDPLEPASNTEFISQLAQFSALEQMQNLNASMNLMLANSMIGKDVCVQTESTGDLIYGTVESVVSQSGVNYLLIDGEYYPVDDVIAVMGGQEEEDASQQLPAQTSLLGMNVTAAVTAEDGTTKTISGIISQLVSENNQIYAVIGNDRVPISAITGISANTEADEAGQADETAGTTETTETVEAE